MTRRPRRGLFLKSYSSNRLCNEPIDIVNFNALVIDFRRARAGDQLRDAIERAGVEARQLLLARLIRPIDRRE